MNALGRPSGGDGGGRASARGEFAFTPENFRQIAEMVHASTGITMPDYKSAMVYSRLAKRLRALGLESFNNYCRLVASQTGLDERQKMIAALTTNMTSFFREPHHFKHLATKVLPPLVEEARRGGRLRIWSAGCSSGEEPYSIALTLLSVMPDAGQYDVRILATDINPNVLDKGRGGLYPEAVMEPVSADQKSRWFRKARTQDGLPAWEATGPLRELIAFRELNLMGDWPMKGTFQAIFCRNVTIYFEPETRDRIWCRFASLLPAGATLYVGHSERMGEEPARVFVQDEFTTYRRLEGRRP